ncbi:MAG: repeat protein [Chlorobi bacterium]|nr:repeat protein [Chlorobiota bacterium]
MHRIFTSFAVCALLAVVTALGQTPKAYNTTFFGKLDPGTASGQWKYSALTGYTAPDGREYALLGGYTGTHIIDITEQPVKQVAFIPAPYSQWREMKTYGTYAYVVSENGRGLQIIDLSHLPASAAELRLDSSVFSRAHTVDQEGHYLYVNGSQVDAGANQGTIIFDLEPDPTKPVMVGKFDGDYAHDAYIRNDTLWVAAINKGRVDVVALGKDRTHPHLVTVFGPAGNTGGTHNVDITTDGSYALTTDEIGSTPKTLKVWDVRDINSVSKVADWTPVPGEIIHNVHIKGNLAYIAWYTAGTRIVDISNPRDPVELGYFDMSPRQGSEYSGNWETYPYFPDGKIIASDMQTGLYVFTYNGARRGMVHGVVRDAITHEPVPFAPIVLEKVGKTITADSAGRYSYEGAADTLPYSVRVYDPEKAGVGSLIVGTTDSEVDIYVNVIPKVSFLLNPVDSITGESMETFSYRVIDDQADGGIRGFSNPQLLKLSQDSTYRIYVGAWGYIPKLVTVKAENQTDKIELARGYYDDAELDLGWMLAAPTDNASSGTWERGVPVEVPNPYDASVDIQPKADNTPGWGDQAFITGISNSVDAGSNDVDSGRTSLTSPAMDLSTYGDPYINCWIWYSNDLRPGVPANDSLDLLLSDDNGKNWHLVRHIAQSEPRTWRPVGIRVKDYVTPSRQTLFCIVASDLFEQNLVEAGMDDFSVSDGAPLVSVDISPARPSGALRNAALRPNPFSGSARIDLTLSSEQHRSRLELFDILGAPVRLIHEGNLPAGPSSFIVTSAGLPAGRYTWRLHLDDGTVTSGAATILH